MAVCLKILEAGRGEQTRMYYDTRKIVVGRSARCDIRLDDDAQVSREHAELHFAPPRVAIRDLNSRNGIAINGVKYDGVINPRLVGYRRLRDGDTVTLGRTAIQVMVATNAAKEEARESAAEEEAHSHASESGGSVAAAMDTASFYLTPQVPGYSILEMIGAGGMSIVFLARKAGENRNVALKLIMPGTDTDERSLQRFFREAEVLKSLDHENIVKLYESGSLTHSGLYLAMEYVRHGDLRHHLESLPGRRASLEEAVDIAIQACRGLGYAHSRGFVHRDVKPQNILLDKRRGEKKVKITDMGLAKSFEEAGLSGITSSFASGGTISYMAPEQINSFKDAKPSADVFGLGATLYEMLTGNVAYDFNAASDRSAVVSCGLTVPISERLPTLPESVAAIVGRCLSPYPEQRYADCNELLKAFAELYG